MLKKYGLKNEATSNVKIKEILDILKLNSTGIYMRDAKFRTDSGIVNLHPTKGTHRVMFVTSFILIHMAVHLQLIYLFTLKKVSIQNIKFRKMIVIVRRIVYMFYILPKLLASKMQYKIYTIKLSNLINEEN